MKIDYFLSPSFLFPERNERTKKKKNISHLCYRLFRTKYKHRVGVIIKGVLDACYHSNSIWNEIKSLDSPRYFVVDFASRIERCVGFEKLGRGISEGGFLDDKSRIPRSFLTYMSIMNYSLKLAQERRTQRSFGVSDLWLDISSRLADVDVVRT